MVHTPNLLQHFMEKIALEDYIENTYGSFMSYEYISKSIFKVSLLDEPYYFIVMFFFQKPLARGWKNVLDQIKAETSIKL